MATSTIGKRERYDLVELILKPDGFLSGIVTQIPHRQRNAELRKILAQYFWSQIPEDERIGLEGRLVEDLGFETARQIKEHAQ